MKKLLFALMWTCLTHCAEQEVSCWQKVPVNVRYTGTAKEIRIWFNQKPINGEIGIGSIEGKDFKPGNHIFNFMKITSVWGGKLDHWKKDNLTDLALDARAQELLVKGKTFILIQDQPGTEKLKIELAQVQPDPLDQTLYTCANFNSSLIQLVKSYIHEHEKEDLSSEKIDQ